MSDNTVQMRRKVQKLGSSTFGVSIPAEWARAHDVDKSDHLLIQESGSGDSLLLIPEDSPTEDRDARIDADELQGESLERALISQYVQGRQLIRIEGSEPLELSHHDGVLAAERRLMGLGAIEQSDRSVTVRCSVAPEDFEISTLLERLHRTEASMRDDALTALVDGDVSAARMVSKRHPQMEKLYFLFLRLLFTTHRNPAQSHGPGVASDIPIVGFRSVASDILSMADAACKVGEIAQDHSGERPDAETSEKLLALHDTVDDVSDLAVTSVMDHDDDTISEAYATFDRIDDRLAAMNDHLAATRPEPLLALQRSTDLLERTAHHAKNSVSTAMDLSFEQSSTNTLEP